MASDTVSRLCRSIAVCQPLLYSRLPVMPALSARAREALQPLERLAHLRFLADDADEVLHHVLQIVLDGVRVLARSRRDRTAPAPWRPPRSTCASSMRRRAVLLRERRGVLAGALAEDDQVRQRVAAEPVGAVQARRPLRRRRRGPARVDICVSPSTRMPPIV